MIRIGARMDGGGGVGSGLPKLPEVTVSEHPVTPSLPMAQRGPADTLPSGVVWLRYWELLLQQAAPKGKQTSTVDLSALHLEFSTQATAHMSRPRLTCKVFNVGREMVSKLSQQYEVIALSAGYITPRAQYGKIFNGSVGFYRSGRQSAVDSFLEVTADGWTMETQTATINTTLPSGNTNKDILKAVAEATGTVVGFISTALPTNGAPRGRTLSGQPQDHLRDLNHSTETHSFIGPDNKLHTLGTKETLPGDAIKLNSDTGLIGVPTQTQGGGISVTALLNPKLQVGRAVHINQADVVRLSQPSPPGQRGSDPGAEPLPPTGVWNPAQQFKIVNSASVTADGIYKIMEVRHQGDSRGNPWYTHLVCIPTAPGASTGLPGQVAPPKLGA